MLAASFSLSSGRRRGCDVMLFLTWFASLCPWFARKLVVSDGLLTVSSLKSAWLQQLSEIIVLVGLGATPRSISKRWNFALSRYFPGR